MTMGEPQIWCVIKTDSVFDNYTLESRRGAITIEVNLDNLVSILKFFEKSNSNELFMQLTRPDSTYRLNIHYMEQQANGSSRGSRFRVPVGMISKETDQTIKEPGLLDADMIIKLPENISSLFKRVERYKSTDLIMLTTSSSGKISLTMENESRQVTISLRMKLQVETVTEKDVDSDATVESDEEMNKTDKNDGEKITSVVIRTKDWRYAMKLCENTKQAIAIITDQRMLVLHCFIDDQKAGQIACCIKTINTE